ncbi:MAG: long-chain-fatty-acid--CoA ligase-like protein, partial [Ramlibacter sp.]|nr:long-chain-fatty-acid--CoA ligase-like protein [Ramlibacter sp.]
MNNATSRAPRYRPLGFGVTRAILRDGANGIRYLRAEPDLQGHAQRMTDRLVHWAETTPDRVFMARRERRADGSTGDWNTVTYRQALESARSIGQALLDRGLDTERPVAILSENGLDHALLALGCLYAGIPHCPVSPAYSLVSQDFEKLRHVLATLTPGLVFAADGRYAKAIAAAVGPEVEVVLGEGRLEGRKTTPLAELLATPPTPAVDAAMRATGPDTIAKFLFTSGSTKLPKAVINTHGMWCANQQQMRQSMPVLAEEPPVLVDWLPWNHTFGGNHNIGLTIYNGGTLYIDDG